MTYDVLKAGSGLKIVAGDGSCYLMAEPIIDNNPAAVYPSATPGLELKSGPMTVRITASDTVTVAGSPGAGSLAGLFSQLLALL